MTMFPDINVEKQDILSEISDRKGITKEEATG
jgi:hypothetical protein